MSDDFATLRCCYAPLRDELSLVGRDMPEMKAAATDLHAFAACGRRAIHYQGWLDPAVVAAPSIDCVRRVRADMGACVSEALLRLYMEPGTLHCRGGDGIDLFGGIGDPRPLGDGTGDLLTALTQWVEQGQPQAITAVRQEHGGVTRRCLLCPWPQLAEFLGGESNDPGRYRCGRED